MESSVSAMAQRAREALGLENGSQAKHFLKYRQQHVHDYPSEYSLGEYSVAEHRTVSDVERLKPKYTECQKVHKLTARTSAQVTFLIQFMFHDSTDFTTPPASFVLFPPQPILNVKSQWVASLVGVVTVGLTAFAVLAIVKKDEKFEREVILVFRS